jgi:altronate hydrolase
MTNILRIHPTDTVAVALTPIAAGATLDGIIARESIPVGHKVALRAVAAGENVTKYGAPIGHATAEIPAGAWVHTHNLATNLAGVLEYQYAPETPAARMGDTHAVFQGYARPDGGVGVRNEVWIIPTVGCVNKPAAALARLARARFAGRGVDAIVHFEHPYGCSQLGDDHDATQTILADLVRHPNAGGVLVLGLGCENNNLAAFRQVLGDAADAPRVRMLNAQDVEDEIEAGLALLEELVAHAETFTRTPVPVSKLVVGLKCGGSDAFSGITANPLVGAFSDRLVAAGGTTLLTEVPEMFGAETLLMNRAVSADVFQQTVDMVNGFKAYFQRHGQAVYENPSPGNKDGGISTLEEKSLGCTQKGGTSAVVDLLAYGARVSQPGLNLLEGPGNDIVAETALAAAGAQIILFTTGRGTPLGAPVPTVKVSTNTALAKRKPHWIDFNAGTLLEGATMPEVADAFFAHILAVASGAPTRNEEHDYREIAIFKDGVTL